MSITFTSPTDMARLDIDTAITFAGGNTSNGSSMRLFADDQFDPNNFFDLGEAEIAPSGDWELIHTFSRAGLRKIIAKIFDDNDKVVDTASIHIQLVTEPVSCALRTGLLVVGGHTIWRLNGDKPFFFKTGMTIDADGAPHAYNPSNTGLDDLQNARDQNGHFVGIALQNGHPVVQKAGDPAPGYYVSTTSLEDKTKPSTSPLHYVDSEKTPYIVLPNKVLTSTTGSLGDFAAVYNSRNDKLCFAIVGDIGPSNHIGEASIATAKALGVPSSPRTGGTDSGIFYVVFPGSRAALGAAWTHGETQATIDAQASSRFEIWGGIDRIKACYAAI